jgi:hypothetical protein
MTQFGVRWKIVMLLATFATSGAIWAEVQPGWC